MINGTAWGIWMFTFDRHMTRHRRRGRPPAAYEYLIQRVRDLSCPDLGELLQILKTAPALPLDEFLLEGGDRPMRRLDSCATHPCERATMCVVVSLARDEAAVRSRWAALRVAWIAAVVRTPRAAPGATGGR